MDRASPLIVRGDQVLSFTADGRLVPIGQSVDCYREALRPLAAKARAWRVEHRLRLQNRLMRLAQDGDVIGLAWAIVL